MAASAVIKPCQPQAESNDGAAFSEPLLKNVGGLSVMSNGQVTSVDGAVLPWLDAYI